MIAREGAVNVAAQGALFSYGPEQATSTRRAAHVLDKLLRRTAPADIPVEQADMLELVVNAAVARSGSRSPTICWPRPRRCCDSGRPVESLTSCD